MATFSGLPAELRNRITNLSGCLDIVQCRECGITFRADLYELLADFQDLPKSETSVFSTGPAKLQLRDQGPFQATQCRRVKVCSSAHAHRFGSSLMSFLASGIVQPPITRTSKQVRADTLSTFYGSHTFYFVIRTQCEDESMIERWLSKIGRDNASRLCKIVAIYSTKQHGKDFVKYTAAAMRKLGVRSGVVELMRTLYPHCACNRCYMRMLTKVKEDSKK
ncbi:hypothetical protein LTR56_002864 [Elasticomyces elasticus]|nr:hypothetical protein LTR56_002864 [Elasticomyces elasticus]KAK3665174.1 hypothetical protein LTR22_003981 [Elasticomyces elasticus]KAK4930651.1 hypothetical protein LTR49_002738 [Elasticomyces elasticus]KAK5738533.1 hypothetical protein LTS12_025552 [Elasticomyces elasticus]